VDIGVVQLLATPLERDIFALLKITMVKIT